MSLLEIGGDSAEIPPYCGYIKETVFYICKWENEKKHPDERSQNNKGKEYLCPVCVCVFVCVCVCVDIVAYSLDLDDTTFLSLWRIITGNCFNPATSPYSLLDPPGK